MGESRLLTQYHDASMAGVITVHRLDTSDRGRTPHWSEDMWCNLMEFYFWTFLSSLFRLWLTAGSWTVEREITSKGSLQYLDVQNFFFYAGCVRHMTTLSHYSEIFTNSVVCSRCLIWTIKLFYLYNDSAVFWLYIFWKGLIYVWDFFISSFYC